MTSVPRRPRAPRSGGRAGFTLLDCVVYIGVLLTISGVAFACLNRLWSVSARMSGTVDDHAAAFRIAERWRIDIRNATGPVRIEGDGVRCIIPTAKGPIVWAQEKDGVIRQVGEEVLTVWATRIAGCTFSPDPRKHVRAVRCDLVFLPRSTRARHTAALGIVAVPPRDLLP